MRQLQNICHWLTVTAPGQRIGVADLPPEVRVAPVLDGGAEERRVRWRAALDRNVRARSGAAKLQWAIATKRNSRRR